MKLHGNYPWDLPGNTKNEALKIATLYCISRNIPYKELADYLGISLSEIQNNIFELRKKGSIKLNNITGKYENINCKIEHICDPFYGEIYDAIVPHINSEYYRIDDVGIYGTSQAIAVRYIINPKQFIWDKNNDRQFETKNGSFIRVIGGNNVSGDFHSIQLNINKYKNNT